MYRSSIDGTGREHLIGLNGWHNRRGKSPMWLIVVEATGRKYDGA